MAKIIIAAGFVTLDAVDRSSEIESLEITPTRPEQEVTNFASVEAWQEFLAGLKSYTLGINFVRDGDASGLESQLWAAAFAAGANAELAWTAKRDPGATSASNPLWSGTVIVTQHAPLTGAVGSAFKNSVTWRGTGKITRATA